MINNMGSYRPEQAVNMFRSRLARMLFFSRFLPWSCGAFFCCGLIILGGRFLFKNWAGLYSAVIIGAGLLTALAVALIRSRRALPDRKKLLIYLEGCSGGDTGGLLSAGLEIELGAWGSRIGNLTLPSLKSTSKYGPLPFLTGVVFLAGALWCPVGNFNSLAVNRLHIDDEVTEIQEKLDVIEEETLAPPTDLVEIKNTLAELKENNDAGNAGRTYELLETLSRRIDSIGEEAGSKLRDSIQAVNMLSTSLDTLAELPADMRPLEASAEMAEIMKKLAAKNPELAELLKQAAANGMNLNKLDPATMQKLAESMKNMSAEMREKLEKMMESKLSQMQQCSSGKCPNPQKCPGGGACEGSEMSLSDWLEDNAPEAGALISALCVNGEPGKGGISRGRADADLDLTGNTQDDGGARKSVQIDSRNDPARSVTLATFAGPPDPNEETKAAAAGNLQGGDTDVEQRQTSIRPEHRAVVEQYFKTKSN